MSHFRHVFSRLHAVLPVIHVSSAGQSLRNTRIARDAGSDGVFLINHGMAAEELLAIHDTVADADRGFWIGVNCLGLAAHEVFGLVSREVGGVWSDSAGIEEGTSKQTYADSVVAARHGRAQSCLYFGGVAFKYQRPVDDLEWVCRIAADYMDVVTTSGPGTGHAADVEKIRRMRRALGAAPLAIASGITPENVAEYLPYADAFLVATGISRSFTELDPARVRDLVVRVRSFEEQARAGGERGLEHVLRQIEPPGSSDRVGVPERFARIILELFPDWFDFAADKFVVYPSPRGWKLIAFNAEGAKVILSTSNSRCMFCIYRAPSGEEAAANMDMHYTPLPEQKKRARAVIHLALHHLFPGHAGLPDELRRMVPEGRVFPPDW
jgi:hypothetical protein